MNSFGLSESEALLLRQVFEQEAAVQRVAIFGSRALGTFQENSDIDLVVYGETDQITIGRILLQLEELPLPYQFDVLNGCDVSDPHMKNHIKKYSQTIYERGHG